MSVSLNVWPREKYLSHVANKVADLPSISERSGKSKIVDSAFQVMGCNTDLRVLLSSRGEGDNGCETYLLQGLRKVPCCCHAVACLPRLPLQSGCRLPRYGGAILVPPLHWYLGWCSICCCPLMPSPSQLWHCPLMSQIWLMECLRLVNQATATLHNCYYFEIFF